MIAGIVDILFGGVVTWMRGRRSEKVEAYRAIATTYDRILDFRISHPEILRLSSEWIPERWRSVYDHGPQEDARWAQYYSMVESHIAFINAVLSARDERLLSKKAYKKQWSRLWSFPVLSIIRPLHSWKMDRISQPMFAIICVLHISKKSGASCILI